MIKTDKGLYDKKIVYLDYFERGIKIKNGGFVKWEAKGDDSRVQIQIRGLYPTDTLQGEVQIISYGEVHTADRILLNYGTGEYAAIWKNKDLAGTGITYEDCDGIIVRISEKRLLKGQWQERENRKEEASAVEPQAEPQVESQAGQQAEPQGEPQRWEPETAEPEVEAIPEPEAAELEVEAIPETEVKQGTEPEVEDIPEPEPEREAEPIVLPLPEAYTMEIPKTAINAEKKTGERRKIEPVLLSGDKWEQLNKQYPRIHPFGDAREYLSITPRDFVILSRQYQNLVQNSFLLHGYYNYGHVILTKLKEREEERFYLGVPGVYFDREKQAALMFGFEGFEAGGDQIAEGGFGYYMKQVEI